MRGDALFRVATVSVIVVIIAFAAFGLLGVTFSKSSTTSDGYTLSVDYAAIARPGLEAPFSITVTRDGAPLPDQLTIGIGSDLLLLLDHYGIQPTPVGSSNDGVWTTWTFDVPPGQTVFAVDFDGRMGPSERWSHEETAFLNIEEDRIVTTRFTLWVLP